MIRNLLHVFKRFKVSSILNILGLSTAFAVFILIMIQVNYDLSFDKKIADAGRIYRVTEKQGETHVSIVSRGMAESLFDYTPQLVAGAIKSSYMNKLYLQTPDNVHEAGFIENTLDVTPSFVDVFHFEMIEGSAKEISNPHTILVPETFEKKAFNGESAVGKQLKSEQGDVYTIGGVFKNFPSNSSLDNVIYRSLDDENLNNWGNKNYYAYIKVSSPEVLKTLNEGFIKSLSGDRMKGRIGVSFEFTSLADVHFQEGMMYDNAPKTNRQTVYILLTIAFVILFIAGVNYLNFSLAIIPARIKSINTQKILGAENIALRLTLIMEGVGVCLLAFVFSLLILQLATFTPVSTLFNTPIDVLSNSGIVILTGVISIILGVVSGVYPVYRMTSVSPVLVLKGGFSLLGKGRIGRNLLIGFQFLASFILIISAGLIYYQNRYLTHAPLGYDKDALIIVDANNQMRSDWNVYKSELEKLASIDGAATNMILFSSQEQYMGRGEPYRGESVNYQCIPVGWDFLRVIGVDVLDGRTFKQEDGERPEGVLIFNETARKTYDLALNEEVGGKEIVGFIPDVKFASLRTEVSPMAFLVSGSFTWFNHVYIKAKKETNPYVAIQDVEHTLAKLDATYPFHIRFFDDTLNEAYEKEQQLSLLITLFSAIAVLISIVGVFGLVMFESEQRRKEVSLRKVLGSSISEVLILFNKSYLSIVVVCFLLSIPVVYYVINRWLENFAYKAPIYWWIFALAGVFVALVVTLTVTLQSYRAATANPVESLKSE